MFLLQYIWSLSLYIITIYIYTYIYGLDIRSARWRSFLHWVCCYSYSWSTKYFTRKSSPPFLYVALETVWKIWIEFSSVCVFLQVPTSSEIKRNTKRPKITTTKPTNKPTPKPQEIWVLLETFCISLKKSRKRPALLWNEDNTLFLPLFLVWTENFSRQRPRVSACAENVAQWSGSSASGLWALVRCRLRCFFPPFHLFKEDTTYLCLSSSQGKKYV